MDIIITPRTLSGELSVIPSKSLAHRYLICAALSDGATELFCQETSADIDATVQCLRAIGADITRTEFGYRIQPIRHIPEKATLNCGESASTLRFLLPVAAALGIDATFRMEGRLPRRPLSPLLDELERMGCTLSRPESDTIRCIGKLRPGSYTIDGSVSSQFITGLLFALPLIAGPTDLVVTGTVESKPYIHMTLAALKLFDAPHFRTPGTVAAEGDWSNGAFWLAANMLGSDINIDNLNYGSLQGDRAVTGILPHLENHCTIDASDIPDLVPILAIVAAAKSGAVFTNAGRLRLKESDRLASTVSMINSLGGSAEAAEEILTVRGTGLTGGIVNTCGDHRIAMAAAIGATVCREPVTVHGAEAVAKSYPKFWDEYRKLGGKYEQYLR